MKEVSTPSTLTIIRGDNKVSHQYLDLAKHILGKGTMVKNNRTGQKCLTVINADFTYDCSDHRIHLLTTKKAYWKKAIAEMLGYIRGCDSASEFRELGTDTWTANANAEGWQKHPMCKGLDDMGRVYGVQGRGWNHYNEFGALTTYDQLNKVYCHLKEGIDDRGEIISYWNVGELDQGCLRPCLYEFQFSILDGTLYLNATQRSVDLALGLGFNQIQVSWFLQVMAQITGLKPGVAYHKLVNIHIYENQLIGIKKQLSRTPYATPRLVINPRIQTLRDLEKSEIADYSVQGYEHHPAISFPFSV